VVCSLALRQTDGAQLLTSSLDGVARVWGMITD
jgi:hypothetical protein